MSRDEPYLHHILDACDRVAAYTKPGRDAFLTEPMAQDAVVRNLEVIGEAVKALTDDAKGSEPEIPWRQIAGMRDRLIHHYFGVDLKLVWEVVDTHLPPLRSATQRLLAATVVSDHDDETES